MRVLGSVAPRLVQVIVATCAAPNVQRAPPVGAVHTRRNELLTTSSIPSRAAKRGVCAREVVGQPNPAMQHSEPVRMPRYILFPEVRAAMVRLPSALPGTRMAPNASANRGLGAIHRIPSRFEATTSHARLVSSAMRIALASSETPQALDKIVAGQTRQVLMRVANTRGLPQAREVRDQPISLELERVLRIGRRRAPDHVSGLVLASRPGSLLASVEVIGPMLAAIGTSHASNCSTSLVGFAVDTERPRTLPGGPTTRCTQRME
jgi:hypothetical protein